MTPIRTLALALSTATVVAATAVPAQAARLVLTDPAGDTWNAGSEPAGSARNTDLRRTTIVHGAKRVSVRATYVDLVQPRRGETITLAIRLRTNDGPKYNAFVLAPFAAPHGRHRLLLERSGDQVSCGGMRHSVSYAQNTITLSIPRSCLKNPSWVQVMAAALDLQGSDGTIDDAKSTGSEPTRWTRRLRKG